MSVERGKRSGEELSAFFIGLLYFIVQWIWQMQNSKHEAAIPIALATMIAIAASGTISSHTLLLYGRSPGKRMIIVNALLFAPFVVIGLLSYGPAREIAVHDDPTLASKWWFVQTWVVTVVGLLAGLVPISLALGLKRIDNKTHVN